MGDRYADCVNITPECPVEATIYGYYPSLGANAFFCAFFGICALVQLYQGIRWKTWTFLVALGLGCFAEAVGYVGRILLHGNPWSNTGFEMQICCLIIAPAFIAAGIYLTLKHVVIALGREYSRIRPKYYTWFFIMCDFFSLVLQGVGGGLAATANNNNTLLNAGSNLMLSGIVIQVFTLAVFGVLAADYFRHVLASKSQLSPDASSLLHARRFRLFLGSIVVSYTCIMIRCIYRIPELSGGWKSTIMQNETDFIVLDGVMIMLATLCLTVFHPGYMFPQMQTNRATKLKAANAAGESDIEKDGNDRH